MALPFFYIEQLDPQSSLITLNEETSKHVIQVLRMKAGEQLHLTDGKGNLLLAEISEAHKRNCVVSMKAASFKPQAVMKVSIAISLVKNASRFEWFLEKATEIGVQEIIPLICERTERQHFRYDRMKGILVSAMLQSQQTWLPVLQEPLKFEEYIRLTSQSEGFKKTSVGSREAVVTDGFEEAVVVSRQTGASEDVYKFIAHCEDAAKQQFSNFQIDKFSNCIILIGPEGDFTSNEIQLAIENNFIPVTLGETRLRTETAGITAAVLLCI